MCNGLVCDSLGRSCGRATGFLGIGVGFLGFLWDAGFFSFFSGFLWIFPLLCFGGSGVLGHGAGSGLGFHGCVQNVTSDTL